MRTSKHGIVCVFEGIDGCGKSTLMREVNARLTQKLAESGSTKVPLCVQEPGTTVVGQAVRDIYLAKHDVSDEVNVLLFNAARLHLIQTTLLGSLTGDVILCDRFFPSTYVYQEEALNEADELYFATEYVCMQAHKLPLVFVYLEIPVEDAVIRLREKGETVSEEDITMLWEYHDRYATWFTTYEYPERVLWLNGLNSVEKNADIVVNGIMCKLTKGE